MSRERIILASSSSAFFTGRQTTLNSAVTLSGYGAHGGKPARVTLAPAPADAGIVFLPADGETVIEAHWSRVDATFLRTQLSANGASVSTVEHLLAALAGLGVDNAHVIVEGDEAPAMDGSAARFVAAIDEAGVVVLPAPRRMLRVVKSVRVADGSAWAAFAPADAVCEPGGSRSRGLRSRGLHLDVEIAFGAGIGRQRLALDLTPGTFRSELAQARTFGFLRDAERLWREGLALGASLDNTVVLDGERVLNPAGLRFADEFVRHKMLDVVGDLALAGAPIIGAFRSYRGGHGLNLALIREAVETGALVMEASGAGRLAGARPPAIISPEENPFL